MAARVAAQAAVAAAATAGHISTRISAKLAVRVVRRVCSRRQGTGPVTLTLQVGAHGLAVATAEDKVVVVLGS